jgi:phosphoribosylpyrophosphate synthetase
MSVGITGKIDFSIITTKTNNKILITIGKKIIIVDDLVQTGNTLHQCALALKNAGALEVNCFVAHGVFPNGAWKDFCKTLNGSKSNSFEKFWLTNSVPNVCQKLPTNDVFEILDLLPLIVSDLDMVPYK